MPATSLYDIYRIYKDLTAPSPDEQMANQQQQEQADYERRLANNQAIMERYNELGPEASLDMRTGLLATNPQYSDKLVPAWVRAQYRQATEAAKPRDRYSNLILSEAGPVGFDREAGQYGNIPLKPGFIPPKPQSRDVTVTTPVYVNTRDKGFGKITADRYKKIEDDYFNADEVYAAAKNVQEQFKDFKPSWFTEPGAKQQVLMPALKWFSSLGASTKGLDKNLSIQGIGEVLALAEATRKLQNWKGNPTPEEFKINFRQFPNALHSPGERKKMFAMIKNKRDLYRDRLMQSIDAAQKGEFDLGFYPDTMISPGGQAETGQRPATQDRYETGEPLLPENVVKYMENLPDLKLHWDPEANDLYTFDPDKSTKKNPFPRSADSPVYHKGALWRVLPDGSLEEIEIPD